MLGKQTKHSSIWRGWLAGGCFLVALTLFGFLVGALIATRVLYTTNMGWDQLADAIGGGALGALVGLITSALMVRKLAFSWRFLLAVLALVAGVLCIVYLRATPARVRPVAQRPITPSPPQFNFQLEMSSPLPENDTVALAYRHLRISSNKMFDYTTWETPPQQCLSGNALFNSQGEAVLEQLRIVLEALPDTLHCPLCNGCIEFSFVFWLGQERRTWSANSDCWKNDETLRPVRFKVEEILENFSDQLECE